MEIIEFESKYTEDFKRLNLEWLTQLFKVEKHDEDVLSQPEKYIIEPGGQIFLCKEEQSIIGCVALMKMEDNCFELTKMAVSNQHRGKKIGQKLMVHSVSYAKNKNWNRLIIYSNKKLNNAIHIYKKYGFSEIPMEKSTPYQRADIKMELPISC